MCHADVWFWMHLRSLHFHHLCSVYVICFLHLFRNLLLFVVPMSSKFKLNLYGPILSYFYNVHTAIQYLCWLTWLMSCLTHRCFRRCFLESSFWTASNMDFLYYPLWIYNPEMNLTHEHGETVICHIQWAKCLPLVLWCVWKETGCALKSRRSSMVFTHEN